MSVVITANELKTRGVSAISKRSCKDEEILVTVRGKTEYVVVSIKKYNYFRECELESAINESRDDIKNGRVVVESIDNHMKRIRRG